MRRTLHRSLLCLLLAITPVVGGCVEKTTEHRVRANAYLRGGDVDKALEEIAAGLKENPSDVPLLILRGKALFEQDKLDEAKTAYQASLNAGKKQGMEDRELGEAHLGLAIVAMRQKSWDEARRKFEKLVEINGKDADARLNLARVCLQMKDMTCAVKHAEEAGHLRGRNENVLFTLGRIYLVDKKHDEARKTFEQICSVVPGAASCPYGVALVAAQQGKKKEAIAKLREAVKLKLPNPDKLADDPLLAPLKDDAEFKAVVQEAKATL